MIINYDKADVLKEKNDFGQNKIQEIKLIAIQYTGSNEAADAYADVIFNSNKQPAHYVVDEEGVIKYAPSTTNLFPSSTKWTQKAINLISNNEPILPPSPFDTVASVMRRYLNPNTLNNQATVFKKIDTETMGDYILIIDTTRDANYDKTSQNLTELIGYLMRVHGFTRDNFWRMGDLIEGTGPYPYYHLKDFNTLLDNAEKVAKNPDMDVPASPYCWQADDHIDSPDHCPYPGQDPEHNHSGHIHHFEPDTRSADTEVKVIKTSAQSIVDEDFETKTINGSTFTESRFQPSSIQSFVAMESNYYEPIYPDLTAPPRSATGLYNESVVSTKQIIEKLAVKEESVEAENEDPLTESASTTENIPQEKIKPVLGKIPNIFDPYPVDDKIAQLEHHAPIVTMEYEESAQIQNNLAYYTINRSINTEKRLVQLENIMATQMRMINRLASRVKINCVYYGGQSVYDKYKCIRCLSDDLINDAAVVSLDQCLNCSRYEPIEGQVYEIMEGDELKPGEANIFDDVQASYMTKQDYIEFTRVEEMNVEDEKPSLNMIENIIRDAEDKSYAKILAEANNFVMNWERKPWDYQSPHISEYRYDFDEIVLDKKSRLDPANKYEDGVKDLTQRKFQRPDYGTTTLGGTTSNGFNYNGSSSVPMYYSINDYVLDPEDMRFKILKYAAECTEFGKEKVFLYTLGAKIIDKKKLPSELVEDALAGNKVNSFVIASERAKDDPNKKAVYADCSSFTNYIYYIASDGKVDIPGTTALLYESKEFEVIGKGKEALEAIKEAIPGDLVLYRGASSGHVAIYAGNDEFYEAAADNGIPEDKQVTKAKVRNQSDFVGILRHNSLSKPAFKNMQYANINMTLANYVQTYQCVGQQNTATSNDQSWTVDSAKITPFVDPNQQMTDNRRCQFARIDQNLPEDMILATGILEYFKKKKRADSMPPPQDFIDASKATGLNVLFLVIHCAQETLWGSSNWMNGNHKGASGKTIYNAYGIKCYNSDPNRVNAKSFAEERGWYTRRDAVIDGAKWIKETYIDGAKTHGIRNTAYFMKWHMGTLIDGNPGNPGTMQYSTHISWAEQRGTMMYELLGYMKGGHKAGLENLEFLLPKFRLPNN